MAHKRKAAASDDEEYETDSVSVSKKKVDKGKKKEREKKRRRKLESEEEAGPAESSKVNGILQRFSATVASMSHPPSMSMEPGPSALSRAGPSSRAVSSSAFPSFPFASSAAVKAAGIETNHGLRGRARGQARGRAASSQQSSRSAGQQTGPVLPPSPEPAVFRCSTVVMMPHGTKVCSLL